MERKPLRKRIIAEFDTIGAFAKAANWSRRKASAIANLQQEPTASDIDTMAKLLHVELPDDFRILFLQKSPQKVNSSQYVRG